MYIENFIKLFSNSAVRVVLSALLVFFLWPVGTNAATLSITTPTTTLFPGETTTLRVSVNTEGVVINNAEAKLLFSPDVIEVVSISKVGSILPMWVEGPFFSNSEGVITFNAGVPTPGYIGNQGFIISAVVKAKKAGQSNFTFSNTAVRANDGLGTNVLTGQRGATIFVAERGSTEDVSQIEINSDADTSVIHSVTHPNQTAWYADSSPEFSWSLPEGTHAVRTLIGNLSNGVPSVYYMPPISKKKVEELEDGTYYFSLQTQSADGWSNVVRYRVNIDTTPPKPFSINFAEGTPEWESPMVAFEASDNASQVVAYEIRVDGKDLERIPFESGTITYKLPQLLSGTHTVSVMAIDSAGNARNVSREFVIVGIDEPIIVYYTNEIESGRPLEVRGTTYPLATVSVIIKEKEDVVLLENVRADSIGNWVLVSSKELSSGAYTLTAYATDKRGARSLETTPVTIVVRSKFIGDIVDIVLNYLSVVILIVAGLGALAYGFMYFWNHFIRTLKRMRRESFEVEKVSKEAFAILKKDISTRTLELRSLGRVSDKEEIAFLDRLKKELGEAEEIITKEIRDISTT